MEFNQENRSFCTPSAVLDTVAEQLADVDLTLPDYCPVSYTHLTLPTN